MLEDIFKEHTKQLAQKIDNDMYEFLENNGYHLERNNVKQIIELRDELAKQDKQVRWETTIVSQSLTDPCDIVIHGLIFFDSISHPLTKEQVDELILKDYFRKNDLIVEEDKECIK